MAAVVMAIAQDKRRLYYMPREQHDYALLSPACEPHFIVFSKDGYLQKRSNEATDFFLCCFCKEWPKASKRKNGNLRHIS